MAIKFFNRKGQYLVPADEDSLNFIMKFKEDTTISGDFKESRNYQFHKKFMALVKIGWENSQEFQEPVPFDVYRRWATIHAGFVDMWHTKKGVMFEAQSIAFDKMDDTKFQEVYKAVLGVIIKDIGTDKETIERELLTFI